MTGDRVGFDLCCCQDLGLGALTRGPDFGDAFFEDSWAYEVDMGLVPDGNWLWEHECDFVSLGDHGFGEPGTGGAEPACDEWWELPAEHEYPHDAVLDPNTAA